MPSSAVLQGPFGRLPPSCMFWVPALRSPPQRFINDFACRSPHARAPDLLASDQATIDSLPDRLADEVPLDRTGLDQVKDRPQRASKLEPLCALHIAFGQVRI